MKKWIERLSTIGGVVASTSIALMVLIILVEVVTRQLGTSTLLAQEYTAYLMLLFTFTSFAVVLKEGRHISITLVCSRLPRRQQELLGLILPVWTFCLVVYMLFYSFEAAMLSLKEEEFAQTVMQTPLFIPKFFIPIGFSLLALQLIVLTTERIRRMKVQRV